MKALFREIRAGDVAAVRARVDREPSLLQATATAPPKKDDGQSPLQVAITSGAANRFAVAELLLDRGADVTFQESSSVSGWTTPVLHDAIAAAVLSSRGYGSTPRADDLADVASALLARLLDLGADVTARDSYGNDAAWRFGLSAKQVWTPGIIDEALLRPGLRRTADLLLAHGADASTPHPTRGTSVLQLFADDPVAELLVPAPAR